ncbi:MAG: hypothetical protein ACRC35_01805 [Angustibacter sp.]
MLVRFSCDGPKPEVAVAQVADLMNHGYRVVVRRGDVVLLRKS